MKKCCLVIISVISLMIISCSSNSESKGTKEAHSDELPVIGRGQIVMIDLGRGTCIPCKMMAPILEELKKTYRGKAGIYFIDIGKYPEQAKKYGIRLIPTQIFFDENGNEVARHEGFMSREEIIEQLVKMGAPKLPPQ